MPFQLDLTFVGKAGNLTLEWSTIKAWTMLANIRLGCMSHTRDKRSSLFVEIVSDEEKTFNNIDTLYVEIKPRALCHKS